MSVIKDGMLPWFETALAGAYRRHSVLSSNLANVDTPGYTPKDVDFGEALQDQLESPEEASPASLPDPLDRPVEEVGLDGNGVDLDTEVAQFTANRLFYQTTLEVVSRKLALLRYAIDEGGR